MYSVIDRIRTFELAQLDVLVLVKKPNIKDV